MDVAVEEIALPVDEQSVIKKQAEAKKEAKRHVEEEVDNEFAKDGVSLDELFKMKPEVFQGAAEDDESSDDKKKGKKTKKKGVSLEFDEGLGEVVGRKKHKRGGDAVGDDWEE